MYLYYYTIRSLNKRVVIVIVTFSDYSVIFSADNSSQHRHQTHPSRNCFHIPYCLYHLLDIHIDATNMTLQVTHTRNHWIYTKDNSSTNHEHASPSLTSTVFPPVPSLHPFPTTTTSSCLLTTCPPSTAYRNSRW